MRTSRNQPPQISAENQHSCQDKIRILNKAKCRQLNLTGKKIEQPKHQICSPSIYPDKHHHQLWQAVDSSNRVSNDMLTLSLSSNPTLTENGRTPVAYKGKKKILTKTGRTLREKTTKSRQNLNEYKKNFIKFTVDSYPRNPSSKSQLKVLWRSQSSNNFIYT